MEQALEDKQLTSLHIPAVDKVVVIQALHTDTMKRCELACCSVP
jgi:hypothetical protein